MRNEEIITKIQNQINKCIIDLNIITSCTLPLSHYKLQESKDEAPLY